MTKLLRVARGMSLVAFALFALDVPAQENLGRVTGLPASPPLRCSSADLASAGKTGS
jgi:hypothetical protein